MMTNKHGQLNFWQTTMTDTNHVPVYKVPPVRKTMDNHIVWFFITALGCLITKIGAESLVFFLKH